MIPVLDQMEGESGDKENQGKVRTRKPIKMDSSLDLEPDDNETCLEDGNAILDDPISSEILYR